MLNHWPFADYHFRNVVDNPLGNVGMSRLFLQRPLPKKRLPHRRTISEFNTGNQRGNTPIACLGCWPNSRFIVAILYAGFRWLASAPKTLPVHPRYMVTTYYFTNSYSITDLSFPMD